MTLEDLAKRRPRRVDLGPTEAVVTAVTPAGVLVTPVGQSDEHPVGPCRGPRAIGGRTIAPGMHVLVVFAGHSPWIVSVDE